MCRRCRGTGRIINRYGLAVRCPDCLGDGRLTPDERHAVWVLRAIGAALAITLIVLQVTGVLPAW